LSKSGNLSIRCGRHVPFGGSGFSTAGAAKVLP
jgi:hypothetical protein